MNKKSKITDGLLVKQYQKGDAKALSLLVKRWHKQFCSKAFWLVKDADLAKDIAQDSWKTIIDKLNQLKEPNYFGSWALRIVYTKSLDSLKANAKQRILLEKYSYAHQLDNLTITNNSSINQKLLKAIYELPEHQQMVIRLFYVQDYSLKEISNVLDVSVGTIKSRLFHARERLKLILKHNNYEK